MCMYPSCIQTIVIGADYLNQCYYNVEQTSHLCHFRFTCAHLVLINTDEGHTAGFHVSDSQTDVKIQALKTQLGWAVKVSCLAEENFSYLITRSERMEAPSADAREAPRFNHEHLQPEELEVNVPPVRTTQQVMG